jgi:toxin CptA
VGIDQWFPKPYLESFLRVWRGVRTSAPSRLLIRINPSRRLAAALLAAHLLAALGVFASSLPATVVAALLIVLVVSLTFSLRRHACLASPRSLVLLELSDTLEIEAEDRSGRRLAGTVLGTTFVAPWLVVINFKVEGRHLPHAVVILPDASDGENYRALRVWLRWRRADAHDR